MKVSENKPHSVHLRLTEQQWDFCRGNAELMGVGVSDFVRMLVNGSMVVAEATEKKLMEKMQLGDLANEDDKNDKQHII